TPLDPRISPEDKAKGNFTNSRAIIDACRPFYWRDKFPPVNTPSAGVMKKAREKFGFLLDKALPRAPSRAGGRIEGQAAAGDEQVLMWRQIAVSVREEPSCGTA